MPEVKKRVLDLFDAAMSQMTEAEQERLLWLCEGLALSARAQGAARESA